MQLSLAQDKLTSILGLALSWRGRRSATKQELQSLIGHLSHAATVVQHGRTFLRRMIDLCKRAGQAHYHVRLSRGCRSDLQWWATFLPRWNGKSILHPPAPQHTITADASGSWGCGAFGSNNSWFQLQWPESWAGYIPYRSQRTSPCGVNPCGVPSTFRQRSSGGSPVFRLRQRCHLDTPVSLPLAHYDIHLQTRHIAGIENTAADALSRDNLTLFSQCCPQANPSPLSVPQALLELLVHQYP